MDKRLDRYKIGIKMIGLDRIGISSFYILSKVFRYSR